MGRGQTSGGKRSKDAPDWLNPAQEPASAPQPVREEKPRRRNKEDEEDEPKGKKGIKWGPIVLLLMMTLPALLPTLFSVADKLQTLGIVSIPSISSLFSESKYAPCLREFYADWAPEKLGDMHNTLAKFEGKEKQLFAKLQKKYGKKVNAARCS
mmetsp:Transcript_32847/g.81797  ORF Transcript_32847/g.81797 Transcript_32847/m.81797 type:complete len:154 (-) Transcript_32847:128-589(-)